MFDHISLNERLLLEREREREREDEGGAGERERFVKWCVIV